MVFGPTLDMLERVDPRLPATLFHLFSGALNRWIRIYDYRDAEERVETLREWTAGEPDADQCELPDVAGCIPPCVRLVPMEEHELGRIKDKIRDPLARKLVEAALGLKRTSGQAERPEMSEDVGQLLCDCNPPLPSLLALFTESDAVAACLDEEAQGMMEVTPEPNLIIPFSPGDAASVQSVFRTFAVACETIAAASRLVDLMPGNDKYVISG